MLRILASYNIKGGVGKTTAAVNLAFLAACDGFRTLLWDLDPQGGASYCLSVKPKVKGGSRSLIKGKRELADVVKPTVYPSLHLIPADRSYRHMDLHLDAQKKPERRLLKLMRPLSQQYDLMFIDCAPSISLVSESVFRAADVLLMPVIPNPLSLRGIDQVGRFLKRRRMQDIQLLPFFSMVDRRKTLHRELADNPPGDLGDFLRNVVPYSSDAERMVLRRAPLCSYAPGCRAGRAYSELWAEVSWRVGLTQPGAAAAG